MLQLIILNSLLTTPFASRYIEEQLQSKKGSGTAENAEEDARKYMSPEDAALYSIPEHLRMSSAHRSEEMLSNQMLSGIPEVDLGIDAKIKNIEATEEAKQKLLQEQKNRKDAPSHFVPTNMAVNFVQHNRCKGDSFPLLDQFFDHLSFPF